MSRFARTELYFLISEVLITFNRDASASSCIVPLLNRYNKIASGHLSHFFRVLEPLFVGDFRATQFPFAFWPERAQNYRASALLFTWTGTPHAAAQPVVVVTTPAHAISFDPDKALGTSVDMPTRRIDTIYGPQVLKESLSAGWGPITYRQNTELTI